MIYVKDSINQTRIQEATYEEKEDRTYRRLTQSDRDLAPLKQDRMIDVCFWLYQKNPLAHSIIRLAVDFILSGGIQYGSDNEKVKDIMDKFWYDGNNQWELKQDMRITDLHVGGEQCYRVFVNEHNGLVRLGIIDPKQIDKIISNKDNVEQLEYITLKSDIATGNEEIKYKIIGSDPDKPYEGEIFYFAINKCSGQKRGISDLYTIADWVDMWDKTMYSVGQRLPNLLNFVWDISIEGAGETELNKRLSQIMAQPPRAGSLRVHNEKEKWNAVSPDLKASDIRELLELMKAPSIHASGFPIHFFGFSDDVNLASAKEMGHPVYKKIKNDQKYVQYMFHQMFDYQIYKAIEAGYLKLSQDEIDDPSLYWVKLPEPSKSDVEKMSKVLKEINESMSMATMNKWASNQTARNLTATYVSELGVETDGEEEEKQIEDESKDDMDEKDKAVLDDNAKKLKDIDDEMEPEDGDIQK